MASGYPSNIPPHGDMNAGYGYSNQQFVNSGPMGVSAPMQPIGAPLPNYMPHNTNTISQGDIVFGSNVGANSMMGELPGNQEEFVGEGSRAGMLSGGPGPGRKKKKKQKSGEEGGKSSLMDDPSSLVDPSLPSMTENQGVEDLLFNSLATPGDTVIGGQYLLNNSLLDQILAEKKMQLMQSPEVMAFIMKQIARK